MTHIPNRAEHQPQQTVAVIQQLSTVETQMHTITQRHKWGWTEAGAAGTQDLRPVESCSHRATRSNVT